MTATRDRVASDGRVILRKATSSVEVKVARSARWSFGTEIGVGSAIRITPTHVRHLASTTRLRYEAVIATLSGTAVVSWRTIELRVIAAVRIEEVLGIALVGPTRHRRARVLVFIHHAISMVHVVGHVAHRDILTVRMMGECWVHGLILHHALLVVDVRTRHHPKIRLLKAIPNGSHLDVGR